MTKADFIDGEQWQACQRIALDIFTDMTNSGMPFSITLASIYLSGVQHAVAICDEKELLK